MGSYYERSPEFLKRQQERRERIEDYFASGGVGASDPLIAVVAQDNLEARQKVAQSADGVGW